MAAVPQVTKTGPKTFVPAELILGGQVVEARAASRVGIGTAGTVKSLGISVTDGINPEALTTDTTVVAGVPTLDAAQRMPVVSVAYGGIEVDGVTYALAAAFGDRLKAAAAGAVTPMAGADDPRAQVGTCTAPAGVAAGAKGPVRTV